MCGDEVVAKIENDNYNNAMKVARDFLIIKIANYTVSLEIGKLKKKIIIEFVHWKIYFSLFWNPPLIWESMKARIGYWETENLIA